MGQQYLIDSNAVIDYLSGNLPPQGMNFMNHHVMKKISKIYQI